MRSLRSATRWLLIHTARETAGCAGISLGGCVSASCSNPGWAGTRSSAWQGLQSLCREDAFPAHAHSRSSHQGGQDPGEAPDRKAQPRPSTSQPASPTIVRQIYGNARWRRLPRLYDTAVVVCRDLPRTQYIQASNIVFACERMAQQCLEHGAPRTGKRAEDALRYLATLMTESRTLVDAISPAELSRLVWSLAVIKQRLRLRDSSLMATAWPWERIHRRALELVTDLDSLRLSKLLWAMSKLEHPLPRELLLALRDRAMQLLASCSPTEISNILCGLTRLHLNPGEDFLIETTAACLVLGLDHRAFSPRVVSTIMTSFALCGFSPGPAMLREVQRKTVAQAPTYGVYELSKLIWAMASLAHHPHDLRSQHEDGSDLLEVIAARVIEDKHHLKPPDVAQLLWAFACLDYHPGPECEEAILQAVARSISEFNQVEIVNLVWGSAILNFRVPETLLHRMASSVRGLAAQLIPQGVAMIAQGFARFNYGHQPLLLALSQQMEAEIRAWEGHSLATFLHAFRKLRFQPAETLLQAAERFTCDNLGDIKAEELQKICQSLARMGHIAQTDFLIKVSERLGTDQKLSVAEILRVQEALQVMGYEKVYMDDWEVDTTTARSEST